MKDVKRFNIIPANDNQKWENYDQAVFFAMHVMADKKPWKFITHTFRSYVGIHKNCKLKFSAYRRLENFFWFIKYEYSFHLSNVEYKRKELIKNNT